MPRSAETPSEQVAAFIRAQIESGELGPGDQLPTVAQLASRHQVSRSTVHKALQVLKAEGLIVTRHGWGTFAAERP